MMTVMAMVRRHRVGERVELIILRHSREKWPFILCRHAHDLDNLLHLVPLEGNRLLAIHLGFLTLEDRP